LDRKSQVIRLRLREVIRRREKETGERITYDWLAKTTGLSRATIEAIGSRPTYNPRLSTIGQLCAALDCALDELLDLSVPISRARGPGRR
jgi:DNA-binding Xre family transcriptional regulator